MAVFLVGIEVSAQLHVGVRRPLSHTDASCPSERATRPRGVVGPKVTDGRSALRSYSAGLQTHVDRPSDPVRRLLPPHDPYTQLYDRETIIDRKYQKEVWKTVGSPGTVLSDGQITGAWRPRKRGRELAITIRTFGPLRDPDKRALQGEAKALGRLRGVASADVEFAVY